MSASKKLKEIFQKNTEFERESPYNFCDRWCERCLHEKQNRCKLYQDEFEQKITCIAHGRESDDPEITAEIMRRQHEDMEDVFEECEELTEIDLDNADNPEFEKIKKHIEFVRSNPLTGTAEQYCKRAHIFLENTFYKKENIKDELIYDFKTVAWYHRLLPVKLNRALAGFHEPATEGDISLYDAVAQFEICKKAISESIKALQKIRQNFPSYHTHILRLLALLHNIHSRVEVMEDGV